MTIQRAVGNAAWMPDAPYLTDRLGMRFYVRAHCGSCNNIIYNGQRLSLLGQAEKIMRLRPEAIRLDFTFEGPRKLKRY